jgi:hypothetical protein
MMQILIATDAMSQHFFALSQLFKMDYYQFLSFSSSLSRGMADLRERPKSKSNPK